MRLIFMGTPASAVPSLRRCVEDGHEVAAVWTQPDRPAGRGKRLHVSPVKEFALGRGLTVRQPEKIRTDAAFDLFTHRTVDAVVVVAYGRILPPAFLRAPLHGCVNVHFSLLPKYRGAAPVNWAVAGGEKTTGVTTMLMDEGLDTGPVLLQRATPIGDEETAPELLARLAEDGAELLSETLARLVELEARPQDESAATHAPLLRREDGLIDWGMSAADIERRVRGFQPWPNAHTTLQGRRLIVLKAEAVAETEGGPARSSGPGEVAEARGDRLVVACGGGTSLRLLDVQPEGKRRIDARDLINGTHVAVGEKLG